MRGIWNHKNNSYIWYHTTPQDRLDSILEHGLKINSLPTCQSSPEPWIYVSTEGFWMEDSVTFEVDLEHIEHEDVGWPFIDLEGPSWESRWQLRVLVDVPPDKLKVHSSLTR